VTTEASKVPAPAPPIATASRADEPTAVDLAVVERQLGRTPRAVRAVAHRCVCGLPDVIESGPRLPDGSPFPTLFYLTCPRAAAAVGTLEAAGLMREMSTRLQTDAALAAAYEAAHRDYLARRDGVERLPGDPGVGGMPTRVKCLHVLVAHSLAAGPGVNPLGDEALAMLPTWGSTGPCVEAGDADPCVAASSPSGPRLQVQPVDAS
jgi:hypothetical protein